jgi:mannosyl-3-phosphoglycerate phosphatase
VNSHTADKTDLGRSNFATAAFVEFAFARILQRNRFRQSGRSAKLKGLSWKLIKDQFRSCRSQLLLSVVSTCCCKGSGLLTLVIVINLDLMKPEMSLLVFSDLDGTLLSHQDYSWEAARPALKRMAGIGAGIVLASSKTGPELSALRDSMGLQHWPAIVENGAGLLEPEATAVLEASTYAQLRADLMKIPANARDFFRGFGDMDMTEICNRTGLPYGDAQRAQQRAFTEPGVWSGTADQKAYFLDQLETYGITAREGGRFLTLSFGQTKADQMALITSRFEPRHTIALGDAPNDIEMLEAADVGVIIANPHKPPLPLLEGEKAGRITRTTYAGPKGWNEAMLAHLEQLEL